MYNKKIEYEEIGTKPILKRILDQECKQLERAIKNLKRQVK